MVVSLSNPNQPLLYLHAPSQSIQFLKFNNPNTYMLKAPNQQFISSLISNTTSTSPHSQCHPHGAQCRIKGHTCSGRGLSLYHLQKIPGVTRSLPINNRKVYYSLLSLTSFAEDVDQFHPPVVHVMNRVNKKGIFAVPICQFGDMKKYLSWWMTRPERYS